MRNILFASINRSTAKIIFPVSKKMVALMMAAGHVGSASDLWSSQIIDLSGSSSTDVDPTRDWGGGEQYANREHLFWATKTLILLQSGNLNFQSQPVMTFLC